MGAWRGCCMCLWLHLVLDLDFVLGLLSLCGLGMGDGGLEGEVGLVCGRGNFDSGYVCIMSGEIIIIIIIISLYHYVYIYTYFYLYFYFYYHDYFYIHDSLRGC